MECSISMLRYLNPIITTTFLLLISLPGTAQEAASSLELRADADIKAAPEKRTAPDPAWYEKTFIHTHHSAGGYSPAWDEQFKAIRPDAVQFHRRAHGKGKQLAEKYGFHLVCTVNESGEYDHLVRYIKDPIERAKYVARENADGSPTGRMRGGRLMQHLCFNSPAVDEFLIPRFADAARRYHPSQIWIDSNVITVNVCYCDYCKGLFKEKHRASPPEKPGDPLWVEWITFHRQSFDRWMLKVVDAVKAEDPNTIVTFNHAYFLAMPETPPKHIRNLSADIHSRPLWMGVYGRYGSGQNIPFDIMPGLTNTWAGTEPKSLEEVLNDTAVIIANGGRLNIGEIPANPKQQPAEAMKVLAAKAAEFAREREPWTLHTRSVPMVAILHSAETHYRRAIPKDDWDIGPVKQDVLSDSGNIETIEVERNPGLSRIYWWNNETAPTYIMGAYEGLIENHVPFDIINADTFLERGAEYSLVILPEQLALKEETIEALETFVESGGVILATGATAQSRLKPLLGLTDSSPIDADAPKGIWDNEAFELIDPLNVRTGSAETVMGYQGAGSPPLVTRRDVGKGQVWYVAADLFGTYYRSSPYTPWRSKTPLKTTDAMRDFIGDLVSKAHPDLAVQIQADPWVETSVRSKTESDLLIQIVDRRREWKPKPATATGPVRVEIQLAQRPAKVLLQPGAEELVFFYEKQHLVLEVPAEKIVLHRIVEIQLAPNPSRDK